MKKSISMLLVGLMYFGILVACNGEEPVPSQFSTSTTEAPPSIDSTVAPILEPGIAPGNEPDSEDSWGNSSANDDGFIPDYRPGHENYYGFYWGEDIIANEKGYAIQDNWVYYSFDLIKNGHLYKMPIGGGPQDVVFLSGPRSGLNISSIRSINVVGDWIYFTGTTGNFIGLNAYKVRTDGTMLQQIFDSRVRGDIYVIGDDLYFFAAQQLDASTQTYHAVRYNLSNDTLDIIIRDISEEACGSRSFIAHRPENDEIWLGESTPQGGLIYSVYSIDGVYLRGEEAPNWFRAYYRGDLVTGGIDGVRGVPDGNNLYYRTDPFSTVPDPGFFRYDLSTKTEHKINNDSPSLDYIMVFGDGYLYYIEGPSRAPALYRVRPDGSGWEPVSWLCP